MGCEFHWDFIHFHIIHHHHKHLSLFKRTFGPQVFTLYFDSFHSINQTKNSHFPLLHHFPSTTMHSSSIITALIAFAGIVSAVPTAMKARDVPVIDVFISEATQDSHASQVEIGVLKVLIGDNGFAPGEPMSISHRFRVMHSPMLPVHSPLGLSPPLYRCISMVRLLLALSTATL
jgi:hypothetical protein